MNQHLILLKLGGSLITDKSKPKTFLPEVVDGIGYQIKQFLDENSDIDLILGNGVGSYAHPPAQKYNLADGLTHSQSRYGFALTQLEAAQVNLLCIEQLQKHLNAVSIHPSNISITDSTEITIFHTDVIENMLTAGLIPVLHDDPTLDLTQGAYITSSEANLTYLAKHFNKLNQYKTIRFIQATDVPGVYDTHKNLIPQITHITVDDIIPHLHDNANPDATGGMEHKIYTSLALAKSGITSQILDGNTPGIILKSLRGDHVQCTTIG